MVFSSAIFLWVFLPVVFVLNYFIKPQYSNILLVIASLIFYAWGEPYLVLLMIASILVNWLVGLGISRFQEQKKLILLAGILFDLSTLGYYKYAGFFVSTINLVLRKDVFNVPSIALPIGISFFTFQAISYILDVYRGDTEAQPKLINTALYISFFPQLIAGPIVKYREINKQIENRTITNTKIAVGFRRFIYGLAKKVLISNTLGLCADTIYGYDLSAMNGTIAWIAALSYTFQIYYDFSGYSDMAIGLGKMFGFDIPENFNYPYLSLSITEFWRRWHISLGSWFREYLYIPLGGNRKGKVRTYVNLVIVFFLTGMWHGASFSFIFWGLYHGLFSIIERFGLKKFCEKFKAFGIAYCFLIVNFGWVFFRVPGIMQAFAVIKRMIMPWQYTNCGIDTGFYADMKTLFIGICAFIGAGLIQSCVPKKLADKWKGSIAEAVYCFGLLILCLASIATNTYNPFIYFQF